MEDLEIISFIYFSRNISILYLTIIKIQYLIFIQNLKKKKKKKFFLK